MKTKSRFWLNLFLLLVAAPALVVYAVYVLEKNGFFQIKDIEIVLETTSEQKNYSKAYIEKLDNKFQSFKGQSLWSFSLQNISDQLKIQKWIKEYHISRVWPATVRVHIEAKEVALLLANSKKLAMGVLSPITMDGDILPEIDTRQAPAKALLKGDVFKTQLDKRKKAIELLDSLPAEGKLGVQQLADINYNSKDGFWVSVIHSDMKVKLGEDQFAMKSARVSQVLDYLEKKNLKARVIDANLSKKVLVRLQQSP